MKPRLQSKVGVKLRIAFHALSHATDNSADLRLFVSVPANSNAVRFL
jgi:hypothetical protein